MHDLKVKKRKRECELRKARDALADRAMKSGGSKDKEPD